MPAEIVRPTIPPLIRRLRRHRAMRVAATVAVVFATLILLVQGGGV